MSGPSKDTQNNKEVENELIKKQKLDEELATREFDAYINKLKSSLELIRTQIKTKSGVQGDPEPGTLCQLLLGDIDELEQQLLTETRAGNYDHAKKTVALLENAITAVYTPGISAWKVDYAVTRFQNEARQSVFSNETRAKITKVAVGLSFAGFVGGLVLGILFAPIPTIIAVVAGLLTYAVFEDAIANVLKKATSPNSHDNYGKNLSKNLSALFYNPPAKVELPAHKPELEKDPLLLAARR